MPRLLLVLALLLHTSTVRAQGFDQAQLTVNLTSGGPASPRGEIWYQVANMGFGDINDVEASIWVLAGSRLVRLDDRKFGFIATGSFRSAGNIQSPIKSGKIVICMTYSSGADQFEVLHFYGNEHYTDPLVRAYGGRLEKFRSTVTEANKSSGLCKSMPESAMRYLR